MKTTCIKCHVTKASECFPVRGLARVHTRRIQCRECNSAAGLKSTKLRKQTTKGRLRQLYKDCKYRHKKKHDGEPITLERFEATYLAHDGICVETGVPFDLQSKDLIPSPDRIDNEVGYVDDNIRFVTWRVNNMRGGLSVDDFHATCTQLIHHNKRKFDAAGALLMLRG